MHAINAETGAVAAVIGRYQGAANRSDTDAIVASYTSDAVFMPQSSPLSVSIDAVRDAYSAMAKAIALDIRFTIAEVRQVAPDWAFLRNTSAGTSKLLANSQTVPEANQKLSLLQDLGGEWKIARYASSVATPAGWKSDGSGRAGCSQAAK